MKNNNNTVNLINNNETETQNCNILIVAVGEAGCKLSNDMIGNGFNGVEILEIAHINHPHSQALSASLIREQISLNSNLVDGMEMLVTQENVDPLSSSLVKSQIFLKPIHGEMKDKSDSTMVTQAVKESLKEFLDVIENFDMIIFVAEMGYNADTETVTILAQAAKESEKLVVAIVSKPLDFEGEESKKNCRRWY